MSSSNAPKGKSIVVILFLGKRKGKHQKGLGENKIKVERYGVQAQECSAGENKA